MPASQYGDPALLIYSLIATLTEPSTTVEGICGGWITKGNGGAAYVNLLPWLLKHHLQI
jgi:hypothetical protein